MFQMRCQKNNKRVQPLIDVKRTNGVYFTANNPFDLVPFKKWADKIKLSRVLEPFAGSNNIIRMLEHHYRISYNSFDIKPQAADVKKQDTLVNFPKGYDTCITNPPWLYRSSASRRGIYYPNIRYDDLYKHCLELALTNCNNVCFLIPGTYIRTKLFRDRLHSVVFINSKLFHDTENPVCMAMFTKKREATKVYYDNEFIGLLNDLEPKPSKASTKIRFNDPKGKLGLIGIDNTKEASIRFCHGDEIRQVKHSDRMITRIDVGYEVSIKRLNNTLAEYRRKTHDVLLSTFKGLREDGQYRRRLDYDTARVLIKQSLYYPISNV